jgi:hypothetical protein
VKHEGNGKPGRDKSRWVDDIMIYIQQVVCGGESWTDLAQDRNR